MYGLRLIVASFLAILIGLGVGVGLAYYRVWSAYDPEVLIDGARGYREAVEPGQPRPKVVVDQTEYHFGVMDDNATMQHSFVFRNEGDGVLKLTPGATTCRCTVVNLPETEIPPGGSTEVTIEWNSKHQAGPYRQSATIHTNDPDRPTVVLSISGEVRSALKVSPLELVFRNVRVGESVHGEIKIFAYIAHDFQILSHEWKDTQGGPQFEVLIKPLSSEELKEAAPAQAGVTIQVRSKPLAAQGTYAQKLLLKTNLPENPLVEIPVEVSVVSDISIFGPGWNEKNGILTFPTIRRTQEAERKLFLACRGPLSQQIRYQIVTVEPKILQVELGTPNILQEGEASLTPLVVRIPKGVEPMNYLGGDQYPFGRIIVSTTHPQVPELQIKVRFAVEP